MENIFSIDFSITFIACTKRYFLNSINSTRFIIYFNTKMTHSGRIGISYKVFEILSEEQSWENSSFSLKAM